MYYQQIEKTPDYIVYTIKDKDVINLIVTLMARTYAEKTCLTSQSGRPEIIHKEHKQLSLCVSGGGIAVLNDNLIEMREGTLVIFNQHVKHAFSASEECFDLYHWHFSEKSEMLDRSIVGELKLESGNV